ncbi:hypothetical protein [Psychrobacter jeotgali]|uniref:hypothetical protein n=1 Tax=Psychrobacter jeotgali TaxID=179010 RepID=UPI0019193A6F|nr:hypothetical protein [Psychrobacter jeotgali]
MDSHLKSCIEKLSYRETNFILFGLRYDQPTTIVPGDNKYLLSLLNREPYKNSNIIQNICDLIHGKIVNDELFSWVKSDLRAAIWLESFYHNYYMDYSIPQAHFYFLNDFLDNLIFNIDITYFTPQASNTAQPQQSIGPYVESRQGYALQEPYMGYPAPIHQRFFRQTFPQQYYQHQQQQLQSTSSYPQSFQGVQQQPQHQLVPNQDDLQYGYRQPQQQQNLMSDDNNAYDQSPFFQFNFAVQEKINFLNQAKMVYIRIMTTRKDTKWLDKGNEDQIYWAVEYLKEHKVLIIPPSFHPSSIDDIFDQICASLDAMDSYLYKLHQHYEVSMNKYLFISRMRKAWSQKKFRDKRDAESAQDLLLPKASKKKLLELSNNYGISSVEMLTSLIDSAYKDQ